MTLKSFPFSSVKPDVDRCVFKKQPPCTDGFALVRYSGIEWFPEKGKHKSVVYFGGLSASHPASLFLLLPQNSIRHNLSLHSRFIRVQNEGTGKSSWWMLNPEGGKSGKSPRRRAASMDNNSKFTKSRGRAAKKKVNTK